MKNIKNGHRNSDVHFYVSLKYIKKPYISKAFASK